MCLRDGSIFSVSSVRNGIRLFLAAATATAAATAGRRVGRRTAAVIVVSATIRVGVVVRPVATQLLESTAIEYVDIGLRTCWSNGMSWSWKRRYHSRESSSGCPWVTVSQRR